MNFDTIYFKIASQKDIVVRLTGDFISLILFVEILKSERDKAAKIYNQDWDDVKESIAFGRRSKGPPSLHYFGSGDLEVTKPGMYLKEIEHNWNWTVLCKVITTYIGKRLYV